MKLKKVFMNLLVITVLILSMSVAVSSTTMTEADIKDASANQTTASVTLTVTDSYTLTLPVAFQFTFNSSVNNYTATGQFSAALTNFPVGKVLNVTVSGNTTQHNSYLWNLTQKNGEEIVAYAYYYVSNVTTAGDHITDADITSKTGLVKSGDSVLRTNETIPAGTKVMHVRTAAIPYNSGTYSETLKFKVSIENA